MLCIATCLLYLDTFRHKIDLILKNFKYKYKLSVRPFFENFSDENLIINSQRPYLKKIICYSIWIICKHFVAIYIKKIRKTYFIQIWNQWGEIENPKYKAKMNVKEMKKALQDELVGLGLISYFPPQSRYRVSPKKCTGFTMSYLQRFWI